MKYTKKGYVQESVSAIIFLIVGVGVCALVLIFVGVLGGQTYQQSYPQILAINSSNPAIYGNVTTAIRQSFVAINTTGSYLPIIVLAVIIFIVLGLIMTLTPNTGYGRGYGYGGSVL